MSGSVSASGSGHPADVPAGEDRILNQEEIDNLLGFTAGRRAGAKQGVQALVSAAGVTYERLPMLEIVFDRLERMLTTSLRNFTAENVDIHIENIYARRFGDYLEGVPLPAMLGVFRAEEWDNYGLVTVDSPMIYSIVDVLLGGRRGCSAMRIEGRPYTTIEASLVERLIRLVLADLSTAFAPITRIDMRFERIETNPRFAAIARPGNACVVVRMRIDMDTRGGMIEFLLPYATLEPVRDTLLQMFMGEKFGRDSIWENHLAREMRQTSVTLDAVLDEQSLSLQDVMRLKVGSLLLLNTRPDSEVVLRCGAVPMLSGRMGRQGERLAVRVEKRIERREDGDA
ncbi:MAG TPA: flagellar motor switch protein FliM [Geminicoccus sp.]|uniref:flagellar motor switch protein FliM n=1 Tax=Geminicoccus sp. TaxID=2024832 RepID=UPI002BF209F6|nr:flagellar motor switch protein FliM [Geminicoccus sp.]HWL69523.1 flagellar motor switch protein FliM [Geminicoccus sp.]